MGTKHDDVSNQQEQLVSKKEPAGREKDEKMLLQQKSYLTLLENEMR